MSLSSVVTMGYLPDSGASLSLVALMGYANGAEPPPPPPPPDVPTQSFYGPALSPAERRRWFGDDDEDPIFESPLKKEARRKAREKLARIEIGLLPPDPTPEDRQEAKEVIEKAVEKKIAKAPPPRSRVDAEELAKKVSKSIREEMLRDKAVEKQQKQKAEAKKLEAARIERENLEKEWAEEENEAMAILAGMLFKD